MGDRPLPNIAGKELFGDFDYFRCMRIEAVHFKIAAIRGLRCYILVKGCKHDHMLTWVLNITEL